LEPAARGHRKVHPGHTPEGQCAAPGGALPVRQRQARGAVPGMSGPGPALAIAGACALSFGGAYAAGRMTREKPAAALAPRQVAVAQAPKPARLASLGT